MEKVSSELINRFEKFAQKSMPDYKIRDIDATPINKVLTYFYGSDEENLDLGINRNKGLLITGPIGSGKTSLLKLLEPQLSDEDSFRIVSMHYVRLKFQEVGLEALKEFTPFQVGRFIENGKCICFDDIGTERPIKYYGTEVDPILEIMLGRYNHYPKTHCTTNLNAAELTERYGNRVGSRMAEMFNIVAFNEKSVDKRLVSM